MESWKIVAMGFGAFIAAKVVAAGLKKWVNLAF